METIDDIVREIRYASKLPNVIDGVESLQLADRIEKAYHREISELIAKAKGIQDYLSQPMAVDNGWADACMDRLEDAAMKLAKHRESTRKE